MGSSSDDSLSVDTEDAKDVVRRIGFIVASLEKAGVPPEELQHFKQVVSRLPLANAAGSNAATPTVASGPEVVAEGVLEKLQRGTQGFAPVWKSRWIRILPGELQVFETAGRPERPDTPFLFSLPLSVQQTRIDPGKEALCKRLGRESMVMVSSTTAVGGTLRCVTLATRDHLALEKWTIFLEKAMSQAGQVAGASIFRACQTGDILRVKHLVSRGVGVNRANSYGCVALHYAVKHAAESAAVAARGGDGAAADQSKIRAQEALRVVVFLMSHGADARAVNNLGETPLELGSRLTAGFPKSRSLLLSILDSSKYQVTGGTIFIVPAAVDKKAPPPQQQLLESVREDAQGEEVDDPATAAAPRGKPAAAAAAAAVASGLTTTTARGVTFSPSRRNRRAKKRYELAKSNLPYVSAAAAGVHAAPSFGEGRCHSVRPGNSRSRNAATTPALPRGNHETELGGPRHRLAAGHGARCSRDDATGGSGGGGVRVEVGTWHQKGGAGTVGVNFKHYRMGRSSGVVVEGGSKRRRRACTGGRPASCPASTSGGDSCGRAQRALNNRSDRSSDPRSGAVAGAAGNRGRRPATTVVDHRGKTGARIGDGKKKKGRSFARRRGRTEEDEDDDGDRGPSIPDREARRQIAEWLRESAGTASAVPPAAAHGAGEHLAETSSYVAMSRRSEVYKSLQAINGDGRGELISAERLRAVLCRVGQPLLPHEMDDLLTENDPTGTGYVSCTRLSKLVARGRLEPLEPGTTYNEEDDVVLQARARRLARQKRLERTAAIAQQAAAEAEAAAEAR